MLVEFYLEGAPHPLATLTNAPVVPSKGALINIVGEPYQVTSVTWCIDHALDLAARRLRANVDIKRVKV